MKTRVIFALLLILLATSCSKDEGDGDDNETEELTITTEMLPRTYLIVDSDTFYAVTANAQPVTPGLPYRYQVNYGTKWNKVSVKAIIR